MNEIFTIQNGGFINASGLSIMSLQLHNDYKLSLPDWLASNFGSNSVWYNESLNNFLSDEPLSPWEHESRNITKQHLFQSDISLDNSMCAVEMLGFVKLEEDDPFSRTSVLDGPSYAAASLHWSRPGDVLDQRANETWECVARGLQENWRQEPEWLSSTAYWTVVFLCPAPNPLVSCSSMLLEYGTVNASHVDLHFKLIMRTMRLLWPAQFVAQIPINMTRSNDASPREVFKYDVGPAMQADRLSYELSGRAPVAVCGVIPYVSSDTGKVQANRAMLLEWIHYYSSLGMLVILYDRDGHNSEIVAQTAHERALGGLKKNLIYHPFTVRSKLDDDESRGRFNISTDLKFDNTENRNMKDLSWKTRFVTQGYDKTHTLTHCRFEAKAAFDIDEVLVVDSDEFLFCPPASRTASAQRDFIRSLLDHRRATGIGQISFRQRITHNRTANPRDCVIDMVNTGMSLFHCFGAYKFYLTGHSVKSLHAGLTCPLTGYHQACPSISAPRAYNCMCPVVEEPEYKCTLLHLSTQQSVYDAPVDEFSYADPAKVRGHISQLWRIADYNIKNRPDLERFWNISTRS